MDPPSMVDGVVRLLLANLVADPAREPSVQQKGSAHV